MKPTALFECPQRRDWDRTDEYPTLKECRREKKHCIPGHIALISGKNFCNHCNFKCE